MSANTTDLEYSDVPFDILSNGFKVRSSSALINKNTYNYIYAAFAEFPIVSSNDVPGLAR